MLPSNSSSSPPRSHPLSHQERQTRFLALTIAIAPLIGSIVYNQGIRLPFLNGCPLLRHTGIPCPGWGLTRSFMAMARGDIVQSAAYHAFGPVLFAAFLIATVHLGVELVKNRSIPAFYSALIWNPRLQILAFLLLLGYHATRLYALGQSGELYTSFIHSPLGQWLN